MPVRAGPPRRHEIEDLAAVCVEQRRGLGAGEHDRVAFGAVLGEGVPDMAEVAREHVACEAPRGDRLGFGSSFMTRLASFARSSSGSMAESVAAVDLVEPGNFGNDFHLAVTLDRRAVMRRLRSIDHHAGE